MRLPPWMSAARRATPERRGPTPETARRLAAAAAALAVIVAVALPATAQATARPVAALVPGMPVALGTAVFLGGLGLGLTLARRPRPAPAPSLLDRVPVPVLLVDRDLVVRHANPALRHLGPPIPARATGRRLGELLPIVGLEPLVEEVFLRDRPVTGLRLALDEAAGGHAVRVSVQPEADGASAVVTVEDLRHTEHLLARLDRLARRAGLQATPEGSPCASS